MTIFHESGEARTRRVRIGLVSLILAVILGVSGLILAARGESVFLTTLGLLGPVLAVLTLFLGVVGLLNRPSLFLNDEGVKVTGFVSPGANWTTAWNVIGSVRRVADLPDQQAFLFYDQAGKLIGLVDERFAEFDLAAQAITQRLAQQGINIEEWIPPHRR